MQPAKPTIAAISTPAALCSTIGSLNQQHQQLQLMVQQ
jgi:hypothetical protein